MDSSDALYNRVYSLFSRLASSHDWNRARYERAVKEGLIVCESEQQAVKPSPVIQVAEAEQDKENQPQGNVIHPSPAQVSKNNKPSNATPQLSVSGSPSVQASPFSPASLPTPPPRVMVTGRSTRRKQRFEPQSSEDDASSQQENENEDSQQSSVKPSLAYQGIEEEKELDLAEMNTSLSYSQPNTSMRGTRLSFSEAVIYPVLPEAESAQIEQEPAMVDELPSVAENDLPVDQEADHVELAELENDEEIEDEPMIRSKKPTKKKRIIEDSDDEGEEYQNDIAHESAAEQDSELDGSPSIPLPIPLPSPNYEHHSHESIDVANLEVPEYKLDEEVADDVEPISHVDEIQQADFADEAPASIDQDEEEAPDEVEEVEEEEEEEFIRPKRNINKQKKRRIIVDDDEEDENDDYQDEEVADEIHDDEAEEVDEDEIAREEDEADRNNSDDEEGESCESSSSCSEEESSSESDSSDEDEEEEWQPSSDEDYEEEGASSKNKNPQKSSQHVPAPRPASKSRKDDKTPKARVSDNKSGQKSDHKQKKKVIAIDSEEEEDYDSEDRDFIASEDENEEVDDADDNEEDHSEQSYDEEEDDSEEEEAEEEDDEDSWSNSDDDLPSRKSKKTHIVPASASKSKSKSAAPQEEVEMSKVAFSRKRVALFKQSYDEFNQRIFSNRLPIDPALVWSKTLRKTAGMCVHRGCDLVRIELSEKVCDTYQKMRETLAHEMCHAAVATIDRIVKAPSHGKLFHKWGKLVTKTMPQLGAVTTCHNYEIFYKFRYQCSNDWCKKSFGRHSDSIDVNKHVCSRCGGSIIKLGRFNADGTPAKERVASGFALYVKQQYSATKASNPLTPHKDIMKLIAVQYQSQKAAIAPASASFAASSVSEEQAELERQMIAFNELTL